MPTSPRCSLPQVHTLTRKLSGEPFPWGGKVQHPRVSEGRHVEVEASQGSAGPSGPTCLGQRCQYHLGS